MRVFKACLIGIGSVLGFVLLGSGYFIAWNTQAEVERLQTEKRVLAVGYYNQGERLNKALAEAAHYRSQLHECSGVVDQCNAAVEHLIQIIESQPTQPRLKWTVPPKSDQ